MTLRRDFIKQATTAAAALSMPALVQATQFNRSIMANNPSLESIGIQLFSLPKMLSSDFLGAMEMLQVMGYTELELFGPYTFSAKSAKDGWKGVAAMLGFDGSGFFGYDIKDLKSIISDHGMNTPACHTDLDTLLMEMGPLADAANYLGQTYVTLPAIPDAKRVTVNDYYKMADTFNEIGANAKKAGIKFGYHNHGYGIKPTADGIVPLEILIENTDPELVFLEMDIFWTAAGGADPVAMLEKYPDRYHMLHIKDMKPKATFSGDGSNAAQWFALFPNMTTVGSGELGVEKIIETGLKTGVKHFFVEQDLVANPEVALKDNIDYLKSL